MKKKWCMSFAAICITGLMLALTAALPKNVCAAQTTQLQLNAKNFPDAWIRQELRAFDADSDAVLDTDEIAQVTSLTLPAGSSFHGLSQLQPFTNLKKLQLGTQKQPLNYRKPLDFGEFASLQRLIIYRDGGNSNVDLSGLKKLQKVVMKNVEGSTWNEQCIDLRQTPALENVSLSCVGYARFDTDQETMIRSLRIEGSSQVSLETIDSFPQLEELTMRNGISSSLRVLDFSGCRRLKKLDLYTSAAEQLILPSSVQEVTMDGFKSSLQQVDASAAVALKKLTLLGGDRLHQPQLRSCSSLTQLHMECLMDGETDFSGYTKLKKLILTDLQTKDAAKKTYSFSGCGRLQTLRLYQLSADRVILPKQGVLSKLTLSGMPVRLLDLSSFDTLYSLTLCNMKSLNKLMLPKQTALKILTLTDVPCIQSLELKKQQHLKHLTLQRLDALKTLDLSKNQALTRLTVGDNSSMRALDLSRNKNLLELHFSYNRKISKLNLSKNTRLKRLTFSHVNFKELPLEKQTRLQELRVQACSIRKLNLSHQKNLLYLEVWKCKYLSSLDLKQNRSLKVLSVSSNEKLTTLAIGEKPKLRELTFAYNKLKKLNLAGVNPKAELELDDEVKVTR